MRIGPERKLRSAMDRIVAGLATKSDKIRALGRAGYARSDIARYLDIRYQHVRNVLVRAESQDQRPGQPGALAPTWVDVGTDGRVVIPAPFRQALGIEHGGSVQVMWEAGEIRLLGRDAAVRRAQNVVSRYVPAGASLADELIADRRAEAAREGSGGGTRRS